MSQLTIKFENDNRFFVLDDSTYEKYDKSIFVLHKRFSETDELLLKDITYDDFIPVYDYLTTNVRNIVLKNVELFDYFGICDAELNLLVKVNEMLKKKKKDDLTKINNFLDGEDKFLILESYDTYKIYKKILEDNSRIIPIQLIMNKGVCSILCVYNCIPVYNKFTKWLDTDVLEIKNSGYNISSIREFVVRLFMRCIFKTSYYYRGNMTPYDYYLNKYIRIMQTSDEIEFIFDIMKLYREIVEIAICKKKSTEYFNRHDFVPIYDENFVINEAELNNVICKLYNENKDINYSLNIPNKSNNLITYYGFANIK